MTIFRLCLIQIRQETARLLYVLFCVGDDPLCPAEFLGVVQSLSTTFLAEIERLTSFIITDAAKSRDLTLQRSSELCQIETLLLLIITMCRSFRTDAMFDIVLKVFYNIREADQEASKHTTA